MHAAIITLKNPSDKPKPRASFASSIGRPHIFHLLLPIAHPFATDIELSSEKMNAQVGGHL